MVPFPHHIKMRTRNWHHVLALGIIVIAPISITRGAQTYQLTDLGALPGTNSYALGINNQGQVVGYFQTFGGTHAFLYSSGTTTDLGLLGGGSAYALSINDPGQIVGFAEVTNSAHAFLFSNGAMTDLGTLGGSASFAFGINSAGEVVGYIDTANGARAFLYNTSGLYQLGTLGGTNSFAYGINSFTQITGTSSTDNDGRTQAFLWQNGALLNLDSLLPAGSGWELENAHGINDKGEIAGWGTINGQQRGFLYGNGSVTDLDTLPGGTNSFALGLNNGGQIVGVSSTHSGTTHAFLWQNGAMTDLNDLLPKDSGWELREARGINDFGQMVGWGIFNGEERAFLLDSNNETQKQGKAALTAGVQAGPLEATRNFKVSPFSGPSGPVTNTPLADAHVRDGSSASVNFGTSTLMELQTSSTSGNNRDVYFKFDISTAPTPLGSGKLRVFASLSANGSVITTAYSVSDTNWTESGITWNNRPSLGSAQTNQTFNVKAGATYDIDVTSYLRSEQNAGHSTVTLALHCTNNTTPLANINSKENASNKPQLILNTNDFPAVSITSPTNNSSFPAPTNLTISATASDGDGTITKVDFFAGSVLLGTDTTSPYSIVWSNAPVGTYGLTARATDDLGAVRALVPREALAQVTV